MRSLFTLLLACSAIFISCDSSIDKDKGFTSLPAKADEDLDKKVDSLSTLVVNINAPRKESSKSDRKITNSVEDEIARQLALNPDLPELLNIKEAYDNATVKVFTDLAAGTDGEAFMVDNASFVVTAITEIIKNYMNNETDLVFMIDKTGSMSDDIEKIAKSTKVLIDAMKAFPDSHVGIALYGDKNADGSKWFTIHKLSSDFDACISTINNVQTTGGGDFPESVNDGIARTIKEMNWTPGKRRVILLLGDAPSLEGSLSEYSTADIISLCKEQDVVMNFYPVVIGMRNEIKGVSKISSTVAKPADVISSVSPNPATNMALVKSNTVDDYTVEIFDINGKILDQKKFHDNNCPIYTDTYPTGVYIVRLTNMTEKTSETVKLVVKR